jgi:aspartate-semialdehyde dehydrogenase
MDQTQVALTHAGSVASEAILERLPESGLTSDSLVLLGDESSIGTRLAYADSYLEVQDPADYGFSDCALVLMPEYDPVIEEKLSSLDTLLVSHAIESDHPVVFAASPDTEINVSYTQASVRVAGPELSCLLGVLPTLHKNYGITGINLVFLQSAESRGKAAIDELAGQAVALLNGREAESTVYPMQIAFNTHPVQKLPKLDADLASVLGNSEICCIHQFVDVPVFHGLTASVQLTFASEVNLDSCQKILNDIAGVQLKEFDASPITDCKQSFSCVINRIEQGQQTAKSLQFWMIADSMRYGLASNYVNVSDILLKSFL